MTETNFHNFVTGIVQYTV